MAEMPRPGELLGDDVHQRDAIHVALAPVKAAVRLVPGEHVGLVQSGDAELVGPTSDPIGIVDPYLNDCVEPGQRCWLFLYPNTVTGLRHIWTHPQFEAVAADVRQQEIAPSAPADVVNQSVAGDRDSLRQDFQKTLAENEDDVETRLVYADWLEEQGEHEEAERQRKWPAAKAWMLELIEECNDEEFGDDDEAFGDPDDHLTFDVLIDFGRAGMEHGDGMVHCGFYESLCWLLYDRRLKFWEHWSVITGIPVPPDVAEESSFRCAC